MVKFVLGPGDIYPTAGDLRFGGTFPVTLRILQLQSQIYQIILGYRHLDVLFSFQGTVSPSTIISTPSFTGDTSTSSTFNLDLYM